MDSASNTTYLNGTAPVHTSIPIQLASSNSNNNNNYSQNSPAINQETFSSNKSQFMNNLDTILFNKNIYQLQNQINSFKNDMETNQNNHSSPPSSNSSPTLTNDSMSSGSSNSANNSPSSTGRDTNKVEEIPAKEPDLSKKPKKSALKLSSSHSPSPQHTQTRVINSKNLNSDLVDFNAGGKRSNLAAKVQRNDSLARFLKGKLLLSQTITNR
jgi:hypothetical protein